LERVWYRGQSRIGSCTGFFRILSEILPFFSFKDWQDFRINPANPVLFEILKPNTESTQKTTTT